MKNPLAGLRRSSPIGRALLGCFVLMLGIEGAVLVARLELPRPTGPHSVGRERVAWVDQSRHELHTPTAGDRREVIAEVWFPSQPGTGRDGAYLDNLSELADVMVETGEVGRLATSGLRWVREHARAGASLSDERAVYPVVFFSPGNATNVRFYAAIAEELASHGYVVVGLDHPYESMAVQLLDGTVVGYRPPPQGPPAAGGQVSDAIQVGGRVADVRFALDRLSGSDAPTWMAGRIDLERVAVMGHSVGGMTAMETCKADDRFHACVNIDGQQAGGALSVAENGKAPTQPFLVLTKEQSTHPVIEERFEAAAQAYRVVVPAASHSAFGDPALLRPRLNPFDRTPDRIIATTRSFLLAFLGDELARDDGGEIGAVRTELDVYVNVYPLRGKPALPTPPTSAAANAVTGG